ncbi:hypothetical protein J2772_001075 [Chryseobacterium jejuense]|nr:hypothetical protein [Chryseobacterium jejuense]
MKYLPFEHIIYSTNLSEEEVITRLSGCVEPTKFGFRKRSDKEYEGIYMRTVLKSIEL